MTMTELKTAQDVLDFLTANDCRLAVSHVKIHPEAARALLEINTKNRTVTQRRVEGHVRNLREGRWLLINNGVAIDSNGDLLDGQHRLLAVVQANIAAEFYLHTGLVPEARAVIDVGKARSGADALTMAGYGRGKTNMAAAAALLYRYENSGLRTAGARGGQPEISYLPHDVLLEFIAELDHDRLLRAEAEAVSIQRNVRGFNRSGLTAMMYLVMCRDVFQAVAFADKLRTGESLHARDPELVLRNMVGRIENKRNDWHFCVYVKAWNARRQGRHVQVLAFRDDEAVPEIL